MGEEVTDVTSDEYSDALWPTLPVIGLLLPGENAGRPSRGISTCILTEDGECLLPTERLAIGSSVSMEGSPFRFR